MTKENKELLLKDLCARLPYDTKCLCKWTKDAPNGTFGCIQELSTFVIDEIEIMHNPQYECQICDVKPYLRSMSSMTEEEFKELTTITELQYEQLELEDWGNGCKTLEFYLSEIPHYCVIKVFDWLNKHHFDYRELIEKGLALEAPEGMYKENN